MNSTHLNIERALCQGTLIKCNLARHPADRLGARVRRQLASSVNTLEFFRDSHLRLR